MDLLELYECSRDLLATGGVSFAMAIRFFWEDDVLFDGEIQPRCTPTWWISHRTTSS